MRDDPASTGSGASARDTPTSIEAETALSVHCAKFSCFVWATRVKSPPTYRFALKPRTANTPRNPAVTFGSHDWSSTPVTGSVLTSWFTGMDVYLKKCPPKYGTPFRVLTACTLPSVFFSQSFAPVEVVSATALPPPPPPAR